MLFFPNAKINLGLNILNKRPDGFHNIETIMIPVTIFDSLEFVKTSKYNITISGEKINVNKDNNICTKAFKLIKENYNIPNISIHLHKNIPSGAGLGGGSADASFLLKFLNDYFSLNISKKDLKNISLKLGSDCPFFIENTTCVATSKGEILKKIKIDLTNYTIIIVYPKININTAWAYNNFSKNSSQKKLSDLIYNTKIENWKHVIKNDFEPIIFKKYPEIEKIKLMLYSSGAIYASLSGSGSSVYGIFNKKDNVKINSEYRVINCDLL